MSNYTDIYFFLFSAAGNLGAEAQHNDLWKPGCMDSSLTSQNCGVEMWVSACCTDFCRCPGNWISRSYNLCSFPTPASVYISQACLLKSSQLENKSGYNLCCPVIRERERMKLRWLSVSLINIHAKCKINWRPYRFPPKCSSTCCILHWNVKLWVCLTVQFVSGHSALLFVFLLWA